MFQQTVSQLPVGAEFLIRTGKIGKVVDHFRGSTLVRFRGSKAVSFTTINGQSIEFERPGKPVTICPTTEVEAL